MRQLDHHPRRFEMTNELHARPFMAMGAPASAVMLAFKPLENAAERDPEVDGAHLRAFIDRHGGAYPAPDANHYMGDFGRFQMKWERHTEFVSYLLVSPRGEDDLFENALGAHFPQEWLEAAPGPVIAATEVEILQVADEAAALALVEGPFAREFDPESMVVARIMDGAAFAVGDFRIHEGGFSRFALVLCRPVGGRRLGRAIQRLLEIENYRIISMLALPVARKISRRLTEIDRELTALIRMVAYLEKSASEEKILEQLTALSADIEAQNAASAFRFGAARAYEAIVHTRIDALREERVEGRQLFSEFMMRRYDPAMRTCRATEQRLADLSTRASRIADLLRTRVDVAMQNQNRQVLTSMNRRAALQLRLQETVEGLSVVAISYYAVSLAAIVLAPIGLAQGLGKEKVAALVALPIIGIVWWLVRRMRQRLADRDHSETEG